MSGALCSVCGERLGIVPGPHTGGTEPVCGPCRRSPPWFAKAAAYGSYDGGLRELVHLLKYDRVRPAARLLGRMLADAITSLEPGFGKSPVLVLPVPLHAAKLRERGFNQAELIARAALKLKPGNRFTLESRALERWRFTQPQTGLTRRQRAENVRGAFAMVHPEKVAGRPVLLVDDVFASGTTASECARMLRRAGASKVWVATVARTLNAEAQGADSPDSSGRLALAAAG
jgi:ComF family protein